MSRVTTTFVDGVTVITADHMNGLVADINDLESGKVNKQTGKGLSTNDYTDAEKTKLANIEAGAQVNPDLSGYATKTDLSTGIAAATIAIEEEMTEQKADVDDELADLKSAFDALEGGTTGQVLRKKSGTDFDVEWASVAQPTDEQVDTAVNDWLDDHPEATTTVQDGSLTEEKFTGATLLAIKNNYVTPQMFGAKGDGVEDDTEALNAAFASGFDVFIPSGTYLTTGFDIALACHIYLDNASFVAKTAYQDHVISINTQIYTHGLLDVNGGLKAYVGVRIANAYGSVIDRIRVSYCLAWGVDIVSGGHQTIKFIYADHCGTKIDLTVSRVSNYVVQVDSELSALAENLLVSGYFQTSYVYDTSGFDTTLPGKYFFHVKAFDSDSKEFTTGSTGAEAVAAGYVSKACTLVFGGAVHLGVDLASQIKIGILDTRMGAAGLGIDARYGHSIDNFYSQADAIPVAVYNLNLGCYYGSVTFEGSKSGYNFISYNYDYSMVVMRSTGYGTPYTASESISLANGPSFRYAPNYIGAISRRSLPFTHNIAAACSISDWTSDVTIIRNRNCKSINISRQDVFSGSHDQIPFGAKKVYFFNSTAGETITLSLNANLINSGYTITGGTNGVLKVESPSTAFVLTIILLGNVFTVYAEALTQATVVPDSQ